MALNITGTGTNNIGLVDAVLIQVNTGFTGTITVAALGSTQNSTPAAGVAIITNPTVGQFFQYGGLHGAGQITVAASATCDITVTSTHRM